MVSSNGDQLIARAMNLIPKEVHFSTKEVGNISLLSLE
jgi:hypothetical protein